MSRRRSLAQQAPLRRSNGAAAPLKAPQRPSKRLSPRKTNVSVPQRSLSVNWLLLEIAALLCSALLGMMLVLGEVLALFTETRWVTDLLSFALGVIVWLLLTAFCLWGWRRLRRLLARYLPILPALLAIVIAIENAWFVLHDAYTPAFLHFRGLVGGKQQAARMTLEHQIYAAYRRQDEGQVMELIQRSQAFRSQIEAAAQAFDLDVNVLWGVAAAESSFLPRDSHDGGRGLFQITAVPEHLLQQVGQRLAVAKLDLDNPRHNAYIAAATLSHYLRDMRGDLFLGLLAYNIGPLNGGLRFIMQQYGARDFVTIQPYLQQWPRDYPIRVLCYALAFRLWQYEGRLPRYEDGDNAAHIQRLGIPGLSTFF